MRNGMTISRDQHRLHEPLSRRLMEMRWGFKNALDLGIAFEREEMEALIERVAEMSTSARQMEDNTRDADAAVPVAYDLATQAADEMKVLTSLLAEMVTTHASDADDQVRCAFVRARTLLEKGEAVFLGKAKS